MHESLAWEMMTSYYKESSDEPTQIAMMIEACEWIILHKCENWFVAAYNLASLYQELGYDELAQEYFEQYEKGRD